MFIQLDDIKLKKIMKDNGDLLPSDNVEKFTNNLCHTILMVRTMCVLGWYTRIMLLS